MTVAEIIIGDDIYIIKDKGLKDKDAEMNDELKENNK